MYLLLKKAVNSNSVPHCGHSDLIDSTTSCKLSCCISDLNLLITFKAKDNPIEKSIIVVPRIMVFINKFSKFALKYGR